MKRGLKIALWTLGGLFSGLLLAIIAIIAFLVADAPSHEDHLSERSESPDGLSLPKFIGT